MCIVVSLRFNFVVLFVSFFIVYKWSFFQSLGTFLTFTYMKNGTIRNDGMELKSKLLLRGIEQLTVYGIAAIVKDQGSLLSYTFGLTRYGLILL
ncbi:unnamed protein product [Camellia sinensis]